MFQVVCIGSSSKDIFFPTKEGVVLDTPEDIVAQKKLVFELGAKYHIDNRFESLGGCAANVACGLRRLGIASVCYTALGTDSIGNWVMEKLAEEKVETNLIKKEDCLTGLSAIIVDENSGERIIFSNQEANERLKIKEAEISDFPWISVTDPSGDWQNVLESVKKVATQSGAKISFNPRGKNIIEDAQKVYDFAGGVEIFFVNKDEAIEIVSKVNVEVKEKEELNDETFLLQELKRTGAQIIIITDGIRGAWVFDGIDILHAEALIVQAIDSTGAGDAFSSGFLASYIASKDIQKSLKAGIANSSNVVGYYGAIKGLLTSEDIINHIEKIKIKKIN